MYIKSHTVKVKKVRVFEGKRENENCEKHNTDCYLS